MMNHIRCGLMDTSTRKLSYESLREVLRNRFLLVDNGQDIIARDRLDSLAIISLIAEFEESFRITLDLSALAISIHFTSVASLLQYLLEYQIPEGEYD